MLAHRLNPARVDHPGAEHTPRFLVQRAGFYCFLPRGVTDEGIRILTSEGTHCRNHSPMELEVIIRVGDVMFSGVNIFGCNLNALVGGAHIVGSLYPIKTTTVGVPAPCGVDRCKVMVITPVA